MIIEEMSQSIHRSHLSLEGMEWPGEDYVDEEPLLLVNNIAYLAPGITDVWYWVYTSLRDEARDEQICPHAPTRSLLPQRGD